ncbi:MAG: PIN domain-containing protein [Acidobacteriaceae bacterium]
MSDRVFLDTNVFVYSFDHSAPHKAKRARALIREALESHKGVVSYQVVQEFFNVALRRLARPMQPTEAEQYLTTVFRPLLAVHSSAGLYAEALRLQGQGGLWWYDALIVAGAQQSGCAVLFSEDLQDGRRFGNLRIENPFD